ncbi:uncharacterized protein PV06_07270 [Exophiala oligosperma]|uniref:Pyruvate decarboxylase n=1 Tax=Exophiala oligosperma TaxID=215243 RepID=A0A0D2AP59_9EURO|nr:uncharacterized protein PV06_07270 [Exophiala oligosperma]KIW41746.1 hypothetical protein PV06_07270 [Exophiala oligosperma]
MSSTKVDLAEYLFTRLRQIGVKSVFGVPGDFNLTTLDYVAPAGLDWVGNANELNAGYAADGYARIRGVSALVTTGGVGELSTINAIAGAYAEMAPVVHIVGTPATHIQGQGLCMHHTLGDGNFRLFADMAARVTVAQTNLVDADTAASEIDRCLRTCVMESRPVYIELPTNMVKARVSRASLGKPLDFSIETDEGFEDTEADLILSKIYASKQPFILVDGFTSRYGISAEADELVRETGFPTSTTPFGKGIVNESYSNFYGIYAGIAGPQVYMPWARGCDLVLRLGPLNSDVNTFGFSTIPDPKTSITFERDSVDICGTRYQNIHVKHLLRRVLSKLDRSSLPKYTPTMDLGDPKQILADLPPTADDEIIAHDTYWRRMSNFFRPGDIILTETGTPSIGGRDFVLPPHTTLINSSIWLSIGYMLGACAGAAQAQRDGMTTTMTDEGLDVVETAKKGRTILFEGDGSFQMTAQAVSDMIRNRLDVIIFLINNDGYTIERWIHGMKADYNDCQPWRYLESLDYFGAPKDDPSYPVLTKRAETWGEMNLILADPTVQAGKGLTMVEVVMGKEDAPDVLKKLVENVSRRSSGEFERGPTTRTGDKKEALVIPTPDEKAMKVAG